MRVKALIIALFAGLLYADKIADSIRRGNVNELKKLLLSDAQFMKESKEGYKYIHLAAYYGNMSEMYYLLNYRNFSDATIIRNNVILGSFRYEDNAKRFLDYLPKSVKNNAKMIYNGRYYIVFIPTSSKEEAVSLLHKLKKYSLSLNTPTKEGNTAMHFYLLKHGLDKEKIKFFKFYKADFCKKDKYGIRPIDIAKRDKKLYMQIINNFGECK